MAHGVSDSVWCEIVGIDIPALFPMRFPCPCKCAQPLRTYCRYLSRQIGRVCVVMGGFSVAP